MNRRDASLESNPFSALFPSLQAAEEYRKQLRKESKLPSTEEPQWQSEQAEKEEPSPPLLDDLCRQQDELVERIFLVSNIASEREISSDLPEFTVYLEKYGAAPLHEVIEKLLDSRLLLKNPSDHLRKNHTDDDKSAEQQAKEGRPIVYLLQCFNRWLHEKNYASVELESLVLRCQSLIFSNISKSFTNMELYAELDVTRSDVHHQFYKMLCENNCAEHNSPPRICLYGVVDYISKTQPEVVATAFKPMLSLLATDLKDDKLVQDNLAIHMNVLKAFAGHPSLAALCVEHEVENSDVSNTSQQKAVTLFEVLLQKSCIVYDSETITLPFFENARRLRLLNGQSLPNEEYQLQNTMDGFHSRLHNIAHGFLKHRTSRGKFLSWIGQFLKKHAHVTRLWTSEQMRISQSDAELLNLTSVLLRLSLPFCTRERSENAGDKGGQPPKFLKIDATYTHATGFQGAFNKGVHALELNKDTCLHSVPQGGSLPLQLPKSYNLITECFFMTHRAIHLGVQGLVKKFHKLDKDLHYELRIVLDIATGRVETGMGIYCSVRGLLTEHAFLLACIQFHGTTARYLNHIAMADNMDAVVPTTLPLRRLEPSCYSYYIPEYVIENMIDFVLFVGRFSPSSMYLLDPFFEDFLLNISIYMGHKSCLSNPHIRASLAEVLGILLPLPGRRNGLYGEQEEIFRRFPYKGFLAVAALQLFVDIEFTSDSHQFIQKFHYRKPLYRILKYLWHQDEAKLAMIGEVQTAITNIDSSSHPLFLRFTDLLLNDAAFLLEGAMESLARIRVMEKEREEGKWDELNEVEKFDKEAELIQNAMMAKYHNRLSNDTLNTLVYLTEAEEVQEFLSNPVLSERVAAMLCDFLLKLVGPKMSALRVKDFSAYDFKPKDLVVDLCKIYINLCQCEDFCRAISRDGRSYNSKLFPMACRVLGRIGNEKLREEMWKISERIKTLSEQEGEEEELFADAPDEFFDALMQTLMKDPVILPTSKQIVDRATITRHLMNDATDPFNRNPLMIRDVIPATELKKRIAEWVEEKRKGNVTELSDKHEV